MHSIIFPLVTFLLATAHIFISKKERTPSRIVEIYLIYIIAILIGINGIFAFMGHAFKADAVAHSIGWPAGSPFQFEIAIANLSYGILGILCIWLRANFWVATVLGHTAFSFGAAFGHIRDIIVNKNYAPNNAGPLLWIGDITIPLVTLILLFVYIRLKRKYRP